MITHVSAFTDNGPYFPPTQGLYQAPDLRWLLFHVRQCMEDGEYMIGIFSNGECKGIWEDCAQPISDGEGGMVLEKPSYVLHRPGSMSEGLWQLMLSRLKRPARPL